MVVKLGSSLGDFLGSVLRGVNKKKRKIIIRSYRYTGFFAGTQRRHFVLY